jgi:hypothetical protein
MPGSIAQKSLACIGGVRHYMLRVITLPYETRLAKKTLSSESFFAAWSNCGTRAKQKIEGHARAYLKLLAEQRERTDLSEKQAEQIAQHIENILGQLPAAIKQAHESIIGVRQIKNGDKILSLYHEANVILRGKAGARVEFGHELLLCESNEGLIADCACSPRCCTFSTRRPRVLCRLLSLTAFVLIVSIRADYPQIPSPATWRPNGRLRLILALKSNGRIFI